MWSKRTICSIQPTQKLENLFRECRRAFRSEVRFAAALIEVGLASAERVSRRFEGEPQFGQRPVGKYVATGCVADCAKIAIGRLCCLLGRRLCARSTPQTRT